MTLRVLAFSLFSFALGASLFAAAPSVTSIRASDASLAEEDRSADRAAIRAHIESIFQAFIDWDADKVYATHSSDWRGFLANSRAPIRGIDEYMRANGFDWPKDKGSKPSPDPSRGYRLGDFDVIFYSPDLAVASFFGEFYKKADSTTLTRFRIMDVYAKRQGSWIQVASHTVVDPIWRLEQMSKPLIVSPQVRQQILSAREAVWRAYFANDRAALEKLIPEEVIAIDDGSAEWSHRDTIFAGAKAFAESGAKLVRLEFPKTEIQVYGNTVILYTTYLYEIEAKGKRTTKSGRGTEIFVRRDNDLVNVGWHLDSDI
ncbi:MAG: nuclear transport factor 2 family protein [Pyrinomonadaceae bacterium]|nr:nuclear transport factor 2 family protein [Pyrinomonadaceae bacterium]